MKSRDDGRHLPKWEFAKRKISPGLDCDDALLEMGLAGWEPWHIEVKDNGWRTVHFKRPMPEVKQ